MYDDEVQNLINRFLFSAKPSSGDSSAPATIGDINKLIEKVVELVRDISQLEK
ncbi:MAG: hypothetical protein ACTTG8_07905 [Catonella sp.]|uniref:hypothetical protein n=1 Tax=Catonella sp. TaxID=2382125 RepID=UPI003FA07FC0